MLRNAVGGGSFPRKKRYKVVILVPCYYRYEGVVGVKLPGKNVT